MPYYRSRWNVGSPPLAMRTGFFALGLFPFILYVISIRKFIASLIMMQGVWGEMEHHLVYCGCIPRETSSLPSVVLANIPYVFLEHVALDGSSSFFIFKAAFP